MSKSHRPSGAQIGNSNGLKYGFFSKLSHYTPQEDDNLKPADDGDELDRAIVVTRMTIHSVVEKNPEDYQLISYNISLLHRLIRTRQQLADRSTDRQRQAINKLARQLSITQNSSQPQGGP